MPRVARNLPQAHAAGGACTNTQCVNLRASYTGMCAARAIVQRELEELEARLGLQRIRSGGHGNLPANAVRVEHTADSRQNTENVHLLRSRLRALNAQIAQCSSTEHDLGVMKAINEKAHDMEESLPNIPDEQLGETVRTIHSLRAMASKMGVEAEPMACGICYEPFRGSDAITGKNCYHAFHPGCISMAAFMTKQTNYRDDNNAYWQFTGYTTDGQGIVTPQYRLKPEFLEEDNVTAKGFPTATWLPCPVCKDPHYANDAYMKMVCKALQTIDQEDTNTVAPLSAPEQLEKWREEKFVLLVEPPETTGIVMLVEARVPNIAPPEGFPAYGKASGVYRQCGFTYDKTGDICGGGMAFYRDIRHDDVLDYLATTPGRLRRTAPQKKDEWYVTDETKDLPESERSWKKRKTLQGGGAWKFDYPSSMVLEAVPIEVVPPAVANLVEAVAIDQVS